MPSFWSGLRGMLGGGSSAEAYLQRGMDKAKRKDNAGAIHEYTYVIDMPHAPEELRAMALFNRALVYAADNNPVVARRDLELVAAMETAPERVRNSAREKLKRIDRRGGK